VAKKKSSLVLAVLPTTSRVHLIDPRLLGRVFYRDDRCPAGSVWYHPNDPNARGDLVILPA